jgi:D-alanine--poly(phosphoribitol) ligase subunit 2
VDEDTAKIKQFIVDEFMPDMSPDELDSDFDLQSGGAVDSLGLLKLVAWMESEFGVSVDESELGPDSLRTVDSIKAFIDERREPANA